MNLHGLVQGVIGAVNPNIPAQVFASTGYTTGADGKRVPTYAAPVTIQIQVQALTYTDLVKLDGLNIQGERRAVYLNGDWNGAVRVDQQGGDLLKFPDHPGGPVRTWLAAMILENWPDWTKIACTLQNA
jgi:hypothetical protein